MDIKEYAKTRDLPLQTAIKILDREELVSQLAGHISAGQTGDEESIILDDAAVSIIDDYIVFKPERKRRQVYRTAASEADEKKAMQDVLKRNGTKIAIAALIILFIYYMTGFILQVAGVISKGTLFLMIFPVLVIVLVAYFIIKRKNNSN